MKFGNILQELILEGPIGKETLTFLFNKWKEEKRDITPEHIMDIYAEFEQKKGGISVENPTPIISSFLRRFTDKDSKYIFQNPTTENLKNIKNYSYKQIISLLTDYPNSKLVTDEEKITTILDDKDKKPTVEKIEASKGLWSDPTTAMIVEGTVRVYRIKTMKEAMDFGYYVEHMNKLYSKQKSPFWCVTRRGTSAGGGSNMWANYRTNKTFYFVIDDKRLKENLDDKYYLSALQKTDSKNEESYVLSPLSNNDDGLKSWEYIVGVYPELADHKSKFVSVKYDPVSETNEETSYISRMSEEPGPYEFARSERRYKEQFINSPAPLKKPLSWQHMDDLLKQKYINTVTTENFKDKLVSYELFKFIQKNDNKSYKHLMSRLNYIFGGNGMSRLSEFYFSESFKLIRVSVDNENIVILRELNSDLHGIFDKNKTDWITHNGITYDSGFKEANYHDAYVDENNNSHFVEIFERGDEKFYVIYDSMSKKKDGHFMSKKKFDELKFYDSDLMSGRKLDPNNDDIDIKEYEY